MIIGAKRKEEVIETRSWGFFNDGIHENNPIFISVVRKWSGRWEIWEMQSAIHGISIAAYRTRKEAISKATEYARKRNLLVE